MYHFIAYFLILFFLIVSCNVYWLFWLILLFCFNVVANLYNMLLKYSPEDKAAKKERHLKKDQAKAEEKIVVQCGINNVTYPFEQGLLL